MREKRSLITGANGFIGYALTKRLLETRPDERLVLHARTAFSPDTIELVGQYPGRTTYRYGDLGDYDIGDDAEIEDVDRVYHLAARIATTGASANVLDENETIDAALFDAYAARDDVRILYASTGEVLGPLWELMAASSDWKWPPPETHGAAAITIPDPRWMYALSKIVGEARLRHSGYAYDWTIARLQNPYGPRASEATLIPQIIKGALKGPPATVYVNDTRPFLYVDDVADALILTMESPHASKRVVNIAGPEITAGQMADAITAVLEDPGAYTKQYREGHLPFHRRALDTAFLDGLGWRPWITLDEGAKKTVEYFKQRYEQED